MLWLGDFDGFGEAFSASIDSKDIPGLLSVCSPLLFSQGPYLRAKDLSHTPSLFAK